MKKLGLPDDRPRRCPWRRCSRTTPPSRNPGASSDSALAVLLVVGERVVAALHAVPVVLGQAGLERHDLLGGRPWRRARRPARASWRRGRRTPRGSSGTSRRDNTTRRAGRGRLAEVDDVAVGLLGVGVDPERRTSPSAPVALQLGQGLDEAGLVGDRRRSRPGRPRSASARGLSTLASSMKLA